MAGLGYGIGSFLEGLSKGAAVGNQMRRQDTEDALNERRMKLLEDQSQRSAKESDLNLKVKQADFDNSQADRTANAPLLAAQRQSQLTTLNDDAATRSTIKDATAAGQADYDAEKAKSIAVGKDAQGNPVYTVDGQAAASKDEAESLFEKNHGTAMDHIRTKMIPAAVQSYIKRGDLASADRFQKWSDDKDVQNGIEDLGRATQSLKMGDWDGATKSLNKVAQNGSYVSQDHHGMAFEPIKDDSGKTTGVRMSYTDKASGQKFSRDFANADEAIHAAGAYLSPQAAFEQQKTDYAATQAAKAEEQKAKNDAAKQITVEAAKSANKMEEDRMKSALTVAEKFAENQGYQDPKEFANSTRDMMKNMADNDMLKVKVTDANGNRVQNRDGSTKMRDMTAEEAVAAAAQRVHQVNMAARQQGAPQGVIPQQAAPQQPGRVVAPAGRSIMGAQAAPGPTAAPPPRRQLPFFAQ